MPTSPQPNAPRARRFADVALALAEVAPTFPPNVLAHGLELTHSLRLAVGRRADEPSLWEELLALRRGPGADAFLATPIGEPPPADLLLERAIVIRALVDALRANRHAFDGQPLNRALVQDPLRTRRVVIESDVVPVVVRLGARYAVLPVGDEHPRQLVDPLADLLRRSARPLRVRFPTRVRAPLVVSLLPVPLREALHLHRVGIEGPWLAWSETATTRPLAVLAAHDLVLDGPGFWCLRGEFGRRRRAMRVALGLGIVDDAGGTDAVGDEEMLRMLSGDSPEALSDLGLGEGTEPVEPGQPLPGFDVDEPLDDSLAGGPAAARPHRHHLGRDAQDEELEFARSVHERADALRAALPDDLVELSGTRLSVVEALVAPSLLSAPPSLRFATIPRSAFSIGDFAYAYCRAQHEAMAVHNPDYPGAGFTFLMPHRLRREDGEPVRGRRAQPVLCSFRTRRGVPEAAETFKRRLQRRLDEADQGEDVLSQVLDDVLRAAIPRAAKALLVRAVEKFPGDGGSFLLGRGLCAASDVPDDALDPFAEIGGVYEGFFAGTCQERGGISLTAVDRGLRRDLCAVGTGLFRFKAPMDLFWSRLGYFLGDAAL